ncbi:BREX system ATP-binding domain-containing protein [Sporomusa acidovorans]|uniref:ATP-binding protein n=1 Tax=Sporomusa acidovorans (strain ATCC 49682 / DSM 3132 / Mol) TaxID=1123286 RepID=A0ABZ3J7H0_SPOA4|nr:BREX system ATP-binding domain-containing protein [Sporomusa acidovorans]OZC19380.1 hypothetical protein SPACI_29700 [Sporomusa acidovorans DSM 3132]SDD78638.1 P-loop protein of unknown function [Sporomusa acidovorans]
MEQYDVSRLNAVRVVESLRAGVPTRISTRRLPDLRPNLTDSIRSDLLTFSEGRIPRGRIVWGQYGQGKTHALTTIEHIALDMGFAVSMVSLSREVSCHNLLQFFSRVAPRVRTPDSTIMGIERALSAGSIEDLENSLVVEPERYTHPLPALVLENFFHTSGEEQNLLYGDLTGIRLPMPELKRIHRAARQANFPKLPPFRVGEHAGAYFGVMADAIRLCGYNGWVILIDELELVGRLGALGRLKAYRNLAWLLNWAESMQYPIYTLAAAATRLQDDIWYGGGKDDRTIMPAMAEERFGEVARREMEVFFERAIGSDSPVVAPVGSDVLIEMLETLADIHGIAYDWIPVLDVRVLVDELGSQPIRTYVRAALESLDIMYIYNETVKMTAAELTEQRLEEETDFLADAADDVL